MYKAKTSRIDISSRVMKFRAELDDDGLNVYRRSDGHLLRWLTAYKNNVARAKKAMRQSTDWRKANNIEGILGEDLSEFAKSFPLGIYGVDSVGRPITYAKTGKWEFNKPNGLRYMIQWLEALEESIKEQDLQTEVLVNQSIMIMDMKGMTLQFFRPTCLKFVMRVIQIYDRHYPEMSSMSFFINVPRYFRFWLKLLRLFMTHHTSTRIKIYDETPMNWRDALLEIVKPKDLVDILSRCQNQNP